MRLSPSLRTSVPYASKMTAFTGTRGTPDRSAVVRLPRGGQSMSQPAVAAEIEREHRGGGQHALADHRAPRADEALPQRAMRAEEIPEHRDGREQVADEDRPPGELAGLRQPEHLHHREEERLEAREQDDEPDEERRLALAHRHEAGRDDAEGDEGQAVQHGVAEDQADGRVEPGRRLDAEEDEGAEEGRRAEGFAAGDVVHEEPHRDDGGADQAGDDAFPQTGALWARHGRTRAYGSTTLVAARAPVGSRSPNSAGPAKATSGGPRRSRDRRGATRRRGSHAACRRAGPSDSPRASMRNSGRRTSRHTTRDRRRTDRTVRADWAA